jgi:8-oxo-dGTP pyrophosphatase MutT (NUDIX family)
LLPHYHRPQTKEQQHPMNVRQSSRLLVINPDDSVLLFRTDDFPLDPELKISAYWFLPGGGLEPDETFEQAARRELWEETGISEVELGPCIWVREQVLDFPGDIGRALAHERYFPAWVNHTTLNFDNLAGYEAQAISGHRWWPLDALRRTTDVVFPEELSTRLEQVLRRELPDEPIAIR